MRQLLWSALLALGGCNVVFSPFARNDPTNCVVDPTICAADQQCNVVKEICEAAGSGPLRCSQLAPSTAPNEDGSFTLYAQGNLSKPFSIYCEMKNGQPIEYLALPQLGVNDNFSQFTAGGAGQGLTVRTQYTRVRLEPESLLIDISDQTFSSSMGQINLNAGQTIVTSMPYGVAMDCVAPESVTGLANVNLLGTPFAVAADAFIALDEMSPGATNLNARADYSMDNQVVALTGGGICGYTVPLPQPTNRPVNFAGTFQLPLVYIGPR